MMKTILNLIIFFCILPIFSQDVNDRKPQRNFSIPANSFISPGFKISISGSSKASQKHSPGERHSFEAAVSNGIFFSSQRRNIYNLENGHLQRDYILNDNIENYSYYNQPYEKVSPLGKISPSYTTKSSEWTFEFSYRGKNYSGNYVLGNNLPFEYFPGTLQYNWSEMQYLIIRNHAINNFFMVQPQLGIREIREEYNRKSDLLGYPLFKTYSYLTEQSRAFAQQAGLTFHFKIIESLRIKVTGKIFQTIGGTLQSERTDFAFNGTGYSMRNIQFKTNKVNIGGRELEGEISYAIRKFNFFLGYNYTEYIREGIRDKNFIPAITVNGSNSDLQFEYLRYFVSNSLFESKYLSVTEDDQKPRFRTLKYMYIGFSVNF